MHKNSITKKKAWSLILKLNSAKPCRKTLLNINENISGHDVDIIYQSGKNFSVPEIIYKISHLDILLSAWEWRSYPTPWLLAHKKSY